MPADALIDRCISHYRILYPLGSGGMPPGSNVITWSLQAAPPNRFGASFAGTDPVYFPTSSNWTGGTPTLQPNGTVTATDTFSGGANANDYYYGINVTLQDPTSGAQQTYNYDPEVENEAASLSH